LIPPPAKQGEAKRGWLLILALARSNPSSILPCLAGEGAKVPCGFVVLTCKANDIASVFGRF